MLSSKVTVIIPVYNGEAFVREAVQSALLQEGVDLEVIAVDDGSRDESLEILHAIAALDPRLKVLQHQGGVNYGVSRTRQLGLVHATGEFIAFLDADDVFRPGKLCRQLQVFEETPEIVMVHTAVEGLDEGSRVIEHPTARWFNQAPETASGYELWEQDYTLKQNHVCNSSVLLRASVARGLPFGMQQLYQYEDWLLWLLLAEKGKFVFLPEVFVQYRIHDSAFTSRIRKDRLLRHYAHIEMLLALAARVESLKFRDRALRTINFHLTCLLLQYENREKGSAQAIALSTPNTHSERDMLSYRLVLAERKLRAGLRRMRTRLFKW